MSANPQTPEDCEDLRKDFTVMNGSKWSATLIKKNCRGYVKVKQLLELGTTPYVKTVTPMTNGKVKIYLGQLMCLLNHSATPQNMTGAVGTDDEDDIQPCLKSDREPGNVRRHYHHKHKIDIDNIIGTDGNVSEKEIDESTIFWNRLWEEHLEVMAIAEPGNDSGIPARAGGYAGGPKAGSHAAGLAAATPTSGRRAALGAKKTKKLPTPALDSDEEEEEVLEGYFTGPEYRPEKPANRGVITKTVNRLGLQNPCDICRDSDKTACTYDLEDCENAALWAGAKFAPPPIIHLENGHTWKKV